MSYIMRNMPYGYGGQGGMIGGGQGVGGSAPASEAGRPGGWFNIQEFLGANVGVPKIQERLQQKGGEQLRTAAETAKEARTGLAEPSIQAFTQDAFNRAMGSQPTGTGFSIAPWSPGSIDVPGTPTPGSPDYAKLRQAVSGQYSPFQGLTGTPQEKAAIVAGQELPTQTNPFARLQPGAAGLMDYFGQVEKPNAQYTPGMSLMDEMLLRGQKEFVKKYPEQLQEQYKAQVTDPTEAARSGREKAHLGAYQSTQTAAKAWQDAIQNYLSGMYGQSEAASQASQVRPGQPTLAETIGALKEAGVRPALDAPGEGIFWSGSNLEKLSPEMQANFINNAYNYVNPQALTSQPVDVGQYNALYDVLGKPVQTLPTQYTPGRYELDPERFRQWWGTQGGFYV